MAETIYNLFLVYQDGVCSQVRYVTHEIDASDDKEALDFLLGRVAIDLNNSKTIKLTKPFDKAEHDARSRLGHSQVLWEEVYQVLGAGEQPLSVITPVVNGIPQVQFRSQLGDPDIYLREDMTQGILMDDWIIKYTRDGGLQLSELIHDDYFKAIKITFNARLHVSAMKLLLSAIDSLAYIEFGDERDVFIKWMNAYADLRPLGITSEELWELRNGLLHMTNLDSRAVNKRKVRRISFHAGAKLFYERDGIHFFSFYELLMEIGRAHARWLETYNVNPEKRVDFVSRYDQTISDSRMAHHGSVPPPRG
ncbi:hypothetical protein ACVIHH_000252 [Bradyrhizobium sp. USDA 4518]